MTLGVLREKLGLNDLNFEVEGGSAWYISFMQGVGAWVAAFLLLCVLGLLGLVHNEGSAMVLGLMGLAAAVAVRQAAAGEFLRQLSLAVLLAAEILLLFGFSGINDPLGWGLLCCVVLALPLMAFADGAGRILTALMMGLVVLIVSAWGDVVPADVYVLLLALLAGFCWLNQIPLLAGRCARVQAPLGYASLVTLFGLLQLSYWEWVRQEQRVGWGTTTLMTCAVLWMVARLQREMRLGLGAGLGSLLGVALLGLASAGVPGLMAGVGVLVLGFAARNVVVQGMAWVYLLVFGTTFYYELSLTLWEKSGVLIASGLLLLTLGHLVRKGS